MPWRSLTCILLAGFSAACSVDPPRRLEEDEAYARYAAPERLPLRVAVAPVRVRQTPRTNWPVFQPLPAEPLAAAEVAALDSASAASLDSSGAAPLGSADLVVASPDDAVEPRVPWPPREYATDEVAFDPRQLQRRLGDVSNWALGCESELLAAGEGGRREASPAELLAEAEAADADLLVELELLRTRCAWIERDGLWWWADLFGFWGLGALPVVFVSDEVYGVEVEARLHVVEVRSGRSLHTGSFKAGYARALNHPQRGWSVGGLLWLHPYTLDEDDLGVAALALEPHARKDIEARVAKALSEGARERLRELTPRIRSGSFGPRTYALVVGVDGPGSEWDFDRPPPLSGAAEDAQRVSEQLRSAGVRVSTLVGNAATQATVSAELGRIAGRLRDSDRLLVYFAGFGRTDREGTPGFVCADGPLRLQDLADRAASEAPAGAMVDWVFDASFGAAAGGRTYPGGAPLARGSLGILVKDRPWRLLCAARPEERAIERSAPGRGLFTEWLLALAAGQGDLNGDGEFSLREAWKTLNRWVAPEAREAGGLQQPCVWGGDYDRAFWPLTPPAPPAAPAPEVGVGAGPAPEAPAPATPAPEAPAPEAPAPEAPAIAPPEAPALPPAPEGE